MAVDKEKSEDKRAAYRIETPRLVLRCWSPMDAATLRAVVDANDDHLRPMIPFMKDEPRTLRQTAEWLRAHRAAFDQDSYYRYAVFDASERTLLGENVLFDRVGPGGREIGYWTRRDAVGKGIATEATAVVVRLAFDILGVERLEIHCAPENRASAAVPAKLGFTHEATLQRRDRDTEDKPIDLMVWSLFADQYPGTPSAGVGMVAYDCTGARIV